jgi:colanic acid biosynthesis glycosyl transferase WcaI
MSRILLVSIVYEPDMVSTATIASRLAKELDRLGHDVAVLTSVPHYNAPVTSNRPRLVSLQDEHGIRVARCFARKDPRLSRRAVDLLVFHVLSCYAALRHFRERDVIVVVSPPLTLAIVGALAKALSGGKLIYNAQELWPDVPRDLGVITNPALLAAISWFERAVYRTADHVVPIGPRFAEVIVERGAPASRVTPIANFVDTEWIKPGPKDNELSRQWGLAAAPVVLYAGNIGLTQDFETLLAAAASLRGRGVQFLVVGGGAARRDLGRRIADLDLPNVRLEDFRPPEQVADLYALADVVAVPLKEGHDRSTTPSKIFSAMAAARPLVVCAGPDTDVAETVVTSQAGLVVAPADVDGFVDAIERILRGDPAAWSAEAAIAAARAHSPAAIARRYDDVIRSLGTGGAWSLRAGRRGRRLVKRALSSARVPQMLRPVGRHLPPRVTDALTVSGLVTVDEGARALRLLAGAGDTIANTVFWRP